MANHKDSTGKEEKYKDHRTEKYINWKYKKRENCLSVIEIVVIVFVMGKKRG